MDGLVKFYNPEKGYGYITPLIGKPLTVEDVFFHRTAVKDLVALPAGARVSFLIVRSEKGVQACNVEVKRQKLRPRDAEVLAGTY